MVSLYRDPSGETVFRSTVNSKSTKPHSASIRSTADRGTELEARIKQLESRLEETKVSLLISFYYKGSFNSSIESEQTG